MRFTQADVDAFNAKQRVSAPEGARPGNGAVEREKSLHEDILDLCIRKGWIALHGSMAHRAFRTPGEWDFTILADGGRVFLIECKTRTGKLSPDQQALRAWADRLGHTVQIIRSMQEFMDVVK